MLCSGDGRKQEQAGDDRHDQEAGDDRLDQESADGDDGEDLPSVAFQDSENGGAGLQEVEGAGGGPGAVVPALSHCG